MSFDAFESGVWSGQPAELYKFTAGTQHWFYTSADQDITYNGNIYLSTPMTRSNIQESGEMGKANVAITLPRDNAVADLFIIYPPGGISTVTINRIHRSDGNAILMWVGRIMNCEWKGGEVEIHTEPLYTSMRRNGLRRYYQLSCPHPLFGKSCAVIQESFKTTGVVHAVTNVTVQLNEVGAFADEYFAGGILSYVNDKGFNESRMILSHVGTILTLTAGIVSLSVGTVVNVYPGCDHTQQMCNDKFNNILNYGGTPYIPPVNPFQFSTLY